MYVAFHVPSGISEAMVPGEILSIVRGLVFLFSTVKWVEKTRAMHEI